MPSEARVLTCVPLVGLVSTVAATEAKKNLSASSEMRFEVARGEHKYVPARSVVSVTVIVLGGNARRRDPTGRRKL